MPFTIKHWPVHDRPRERVRTLGAKALSTRELLALLIETGLSPRDGTAGRSAGELGGGLLGAVAEGDGAGALRRLVGAPVSAGAGGGGGGGGGEGRPSNPPPGGWGP